ncbi:hypothetical protein GGI00_001064 [Coemansia sp. RSA 2681]|nr:hypothetical protein GGI00_001064 [Coemansia sp. RSA 2681]
MAKKWKGSTVLSYRAALMDLQPESARRDISQSTEFQAFFSGVQAETVLVIERESVDIAPILAHIRATPLEQLSRSELTARVCWLIGVTGMMRPSDIARVMVNRTTYLEDGARLVVLAPKEKRQNMSIERPVYISEHRDSAICPVRALRYYIDNVVNDGDEEPLWIDHPRLADVRYQPLMRYTRDSRRALSSDRISNYIQQLMSLAPRTDGKPASARSLGADNAIRADVPEEVVATQGNWSGTKTVHEHYRRSMRQRTRMSERVLGISDTESATSQSEAKSTNSFDPEK